MSKNATIIIQGLLKNKIETDAAVQCGMCKHMIDSFTCKIYPTIEHDIPFKYRLGKEACPDFKQTIDENI